MQRTYFFSQMLMAAVFFAIGVYAIVASLGWPMASALFPRIAGVMLILFSGAEGVKLLWQYRRAGDVGVARVMDVQRVIDVDTGEATRRIIIMIAWCSGFVFAVWLVGFYVSIPAMVFLFMKGQTKSGWILSVLMAGLAYAFFWGVFVSLFKFIFREGALLRWFGN